VSVSGLLLSSSPFAAATTISRACAARLRTSHCGTGERAPARSARGPRSPRKQWFREGVMAAPNCGRRWARRVLFNGPLCSLLAYSVNFFSSAGSLSRTPHTRSGDASGPMVSNHR
jgi:hypothetical protein